MGDVEFCGYCEKDLGQYFNLRAVGFTDEKVLVKKWCGSCEPDDEEDLEAVAALADLFFSCSSGGCSGG